MANELQIQLEGIAGVASITAETIDEPAFGGVFAVIEREAQAVRDGLDGIIEAHDRQSQSLANDVAREIGSEDYDDPLDQLTLTLSRAEALTQAVTDVGMSGEKRDLVGLSDMIRRELRAARDICLDDLHTSKYWRRKSVGGDV